jgi:hypothetical protein
MRVTRSTSSRTSCVALLAAVILAGCSSGAPPAEGGAIGSRALTIGPGVGSRLAVLVPDGLDPADPRVQAWADAAREEGLLVAFVTDSELLALGPSAAATAFRGIVLPDQVHAQATDAMIGALTDYANAGGWLMLVYDFGSLLPDSNLFPAAGPSRLSSLAGVPYLFYAARYPVGDVVGRGPVSGKTATLRELQIPPGKSGVDPAVTCQNDPRVTADASSATASAAVASPGLLAVSAVDPGGLRRYRHSVQFDTSSASPSLTARAAAAPKRPPRPATNPEDPAAVQAISGYAYGALTYPTYLTGPAAAFDVANGFDQVLLTSTFGRVDPSSGDGVTGVAAARRRQGSGGVLFVNLPLGWLKGETDAMLMHGFLRYFGATLLGMPRLSDHPNATGGLVFNWHVDAAEALAPIATLDSLGVWDRGPFSIHVTAGPDTVSVGDGLGLDVAGNPITQGWLRYFVQKGHQLGSHGGWDHDIFGVGANEWNRDAYAVGTSTFLDLLDLNKRALDAVISTPYPASGYPGFASPVVEYAAPEGNNPHWALDWLEQTGHVGYYFLGHTGTGPTRAYRPPVSDDSGLPGELLNPSMWAFPLNPMGCYATFEEFTDFGVDPVAVTSWYGALIDFVARNHTSRLVYAHPPGAASSPTVLSAMFGFADAKGTRFRWYTMTELARFNARRLDVDWVEGGAGTARVFEASHPTSLRDVAWVLPRAAYSKPKITSGNATLTSDSASWIVSATGGTSLSFTANRVQ